MWSDSPARMETPAPDVDANIMAVAETTIALTPRSGERVGVKGLLLGTFSTPIHEGKVTGTGSLPSPH